MKQNFYKITASNKFQAVIAFLRKELGWKASDGLVSCWARRGRMESVEGQHKVASSIELVVEPPPPFLAQLSSRRPLLTPSLHHRAVPLYQRLIQSSTRRYSGEPVQGEITSLPLSAFADPESPLAVLRDRQSPHRQLQVRWCSLSSSYQRSS
jgi:hypothetical protein